MPPPSTYAESCALLEIAPGASAEEIRRGHRRLAMLWHPDRFEPDSPLLAEAREKIAAINEAYRYLMEHPGPEGPPLRPGVAAARPGLHGWRWGAALLAGVGALAVLASFRFGAARPGLDPKTRAAPGPALPPGAPEAARAEPQPPAPTLVVDQAALVIFWPSRKELDEAPAPMADEVARFLETAQKVREQVQKVRPELEVHLTDAEIIQVQGVAVRRSQTCGYGYLLYAPANHDSPSRQLILEGMQPLDKLVNCVTDTFPVQEHPAHPD